MRRPPRRARQRPRRCQDMKSLLLAAALGAPALFAASAHASVTPPTPTGAAPVGFAHTTLTDFFRTEPLAGDSGSRRVPLRIWYPAASPGAEPAKTLTAAEQAAWRTRPRHRPARWTGSAPPPPKPLRPPGAATPSCCCRPAGERPPRCRAPTLPTSPATATSSSAWIIRVTRRSSIWATVSSCRRHRAGLGGDDRDPRTRHALRGLTPGLAARHRPARPRPHRRLRTLQRRRDRPQRDAGRPPDPRGWTSTGASTARRPTVGWTARSAFCRATCRASFTRRSTSSASAPRGPSPIARFPEGAHHSFADNVWLVPQLGLDPVESDVGTGDPAAAVQRQNALLNRFFDRYIKG